MFQYPRISEYIKRNSKKEEPIIPNDILFDLARTLELVANECNCNDGKAESVGLDWSYVHKLNKRTQYWLNKEQKNGKLRSSCNNKSD